MKRTQARIKADCARFACRSCRTKTGWRHQHWCELADRVAPSCADCCYWSQHKSVCEHPSQRKGERYEADQNPI